MCKSIKVLFFPLSRDVDPVVLAIRRGDAKAVNDLATSAAHCLLKENKDGWIPLHDAAFCGQTECLKSLLRGMPLTALLRVSDSVQFESHGLSDNVGKGECIHSNKHCGDGTFSK